MSLTDKKYRSQPVLKALVKTRSKLVRENNHAVETLRMTLSHIRIPSLACAVLNYPHRVNLNACQGSLIEKKTSQDHRPTVKVFLFRMVQLFPRKKMNQDQVAMLFAMCRQLQTQVMNASLCPRSKTYFRSLSP